MKQTLIVLAMLCCAMFAAAAEPKNLLKEPMTISNPNTTVFKDGVYTVTNPDAKTKSILKYKIKLAAENITAVTFAVEAKAIENTGYHGSAFGMYLCLIHTDNTRTNYVNFGVGKDTFDWRLVQRPFTAKKPIKEIDVYVQYNNAKGTVAFRNPQVYTGTVKIKAGK